MRTVVDVIATVELSSSLQPVESSTGRDTVGAAVRRIENDFADRPIKIECLVVLRLDEVSHAVVGE